MTQSSLSRLAGPCGLAAGALIVGAQVVMFPFDPADHVATSTAPAFQIGGVVYLAGFVALLLFVVASHGWHEQHSGRLGVVATVVAVVGTFMLGGDLWFETFAVPWLADQAPGALSTDPTLLLALGAISSYLLFAIGWLLYGIAAFRARVFPRPIAVMIAVSGVLGYRALLSPWAVPLALSVLSLGVWMLRRQPLRTSRPGPASTGNRHRAGRSR
jgi:hypothetical protein